MQSVTVVPGKHNHTASYANLEIPALTEQSWQRFCFLVVRYCCVTYTHVLVYFAWLPDFCSVLDIKEEVEG